MSGRPRLRSRTLVDTLFRWAERNDAHAVPPRSLEHPGVIAQLWATFKLAITALAAPVWIPSVLWRAATNQRRAVRYMSLFSHALRELQRHGTAEVADMSVADVDATRRIVITSDLHRSAAGRLDVPGRQGTKRLYEVMLDFYDERKWTLIENGDIEDFWVVGGSTYGSVYDALRILGGALTRVRGATLLLETTYIEHLDRIIRNNAGIYRRIRENFAADGRYLRVIGNHDDALRWYRVRQRLFDRIGHVPMVDALSLRDGADLVAVVTHGHFADAWNAPTRDNLGKLSSWLACTLLDVPFLDTPEGLPPAEATTSLLAGKWPNRLITVHPTFGANSHYDSLDEELLFHAVKKINTSNVWLLLGHTHSPVSEPVSRDATRWKRYVNSGCGVAQSLVTAIEWNGDFAPEGAALVAWAYADESTPREAIVAYDGGRPIARVLLEHGAEDRLSVRAPELRS